MSKECMIIRGRQEGPCGLACARKSYSDAESERKRDTKLCLSVTYCAAVVSRTIGTRHENMIEDDDFKSCTKAKQQNLKLALSRNPKETHAQAPRPQTPSMSIKSSVITTNFLPLSSISLNLPYRSPLAKQVDRVESQETVTKDRSDEKLQT